MLHIIYRSYGGENTKGRPSFYSKLLALQSLVRAADHVEGPVEILYLNDGAMPADRLALMERTGEVLARHKLGNKGSLRTALALPERRRWAPHDLVWLAEDDYLYTPHALRDMLSASRAFPSAAYFGLYASIGHRPPSGGEQPEFAPVPAAWRDSTPILVNGHPWRRGLSHCATFGARVQPLLEDRALFHAALWTGAGWDQTMCLLYQSFMPFTPRLLAAPILDAPNTFRRARGGAITAVRLAVSAWQLARTRTGARPRLLVAPEPALATHLESAYLAVGTDWNAVARETAAWAETRDSDPLGRSSVGEGS
ncbi:MAG TPA: hypothetical protein VJR89_08620, partial [Polyangiales bacterium]|nr:hypothetical protein [Polyangiales bacterium]